MKDISYWAVPGVDREKLTRVKVVATKRFCEELLMRCCEVFDVPFDEVKSKKREKSMVFARQAFCYLAKKEKYTLGNIGKLINRDHSTVLYSIKQVECYIQSNDKVFLRKFGKYI